MTEIEPGLWQRIKGVLIRHAGLLTLGLLLLVGWWCDGHFLQHQVQTYVFAQAEWLIHGMTTEWQSARVALLLPSITLFLAFANLYLKISARAPSLQRRLRPGTFLNIPFAVYFAVYLLLVILAHVVLAPKIDNWFVKILVPALVGIGAANADVKFGGFSLQPFADFLQGLEAVVEAGISNRMNEIDIAKRASLRDQLITQAPKTRLERECSLLGMTAAQLQDLLTKSNGDEDTYKGLLSVEIIKQSEPNAWRLVAETSRASSRYRIRWWT